MEKNLHKLLLEAYIKAMQIAAKPSRDERKAKQKGMEGKKRNSKSDEIECV